VGHSVTLHGCVIEDRCLIGMGSIILNGAKIGAGSIIAAGTLIPERTVVEPGSLWMGSPGKFRRKLDQKDQESIMRYANNYLGYKEEYLREREEISSQFSFGNQCRSERLHARPEAEYAESGLLQFGNDKHFSCA
jgi:carbonic anhydrase/acetyltransferase-like protein (isoleucine patch superfamily)